MVCTTKLLAVEKDLVSRMVIFANVSHEDKQYNKPDGLKTAIFVKYHREEQIKL